MVHLSYLIIRDLYWPIKAGYDGVQQKSVFPTVWLRSAVKIL